MTPARSAFARHARRALTTAAAVVIAAPVAIVVTAPAAHAVPSPVAYWNWETSLVTPTSGGSDLLYSSGATLGYDNPRGVLQLTYASSIVSIPSSASWLPSPTSAMTVTAWVKMASCNASHPQIFNLQGMRQLAAPVSGVSGQCYLKGIAGSNGGDNWQEDSSKRFPLNEWVFIAQSIDPTSTGRQYVKSATLGEATFTYPAAPLSASGLLVGKGLEGWDPGSPMMLVDDLRVFNSQLSLADLQSLAAPAPSPHTVSFAANGGTGSMAAQTATGSTALTANALAAPTGKVFAGWNTAADGSGTAYADQASFPFAADATLYAQWGIPITMSCSQDTVLSGAVPGDVILLTLDSGCAALPQPGGHWEYWNLNGRVSPTYDATQSGFLSAPSSGVHANYSYASDWWVHNPGPLVSKLLATDGGGNALANGSVVMSLDNTDGSALPGNANARGLALVYRSSYSVTFDANGGTGSMTAQSASSATALTSNGFTRSGYTFAGWNTQQGGGGTSYANGASFPFTSAATLYAQWTAAPSSGGGSGSGSGGSSGGSGGSSSGGSTSASSGTMRPVTSTSATTTAPQSDPAARPVVGQAPAVAPEVARVSLSTLTPARITALPVALVPAIPARVLATAPIAKIKAFTPAQLAVFTPAQRKALTVTQVAALTKAQRKALGR